MHIHVYISWTGEIKPRPILVSGNELGRQSLARAAKSRNLIHDVFRRLRFGGLTWPQNTHDINVLYTVKNKRTVHCGQAERRPYD